MKDRQKRVNETSNSIDWLVRCPTRGVRLYIAFSFRLPSRYIGNFIRAGDYPKLIQS